MGEVDQSVTEITDVKASTQFVLGAQLRIGSTMWGFEQRWFSFLGDTREYILTGASNTDTELFLHEHWVAVLTIVHHQAKKAPRLRAFLYQKVKRLS